MRLELLQQADAVAKDLGMSRSALLALALREFLSRRRQEEIVERLNKVYASSEPPADKRRLAGMRKKFSATVRDEW